MPIRRLTVFAVFVAAMFALAPVQAKTSHSQTRSAVAKHAHQRTSVHHHSTHAKHGKKVAVARHRVSHTRSGALQASFIDTDVVSTANAVPGMATNPALSSFGLLQAAPQGMTATPFAAPAVSPWLQSASTVNPMSMLAQSKPTRSMIPAKVLALSTGNVIGEHNAAMADFATSASAQDLATTDADGTRDITDLRKALIAMAMKMRDIQYVRGGHDPTTGFDCSGFVRYVFAHAVGMQLPTNSAAQFLDGLKVSRADMQPGDLVFFHTHGKHRRVTHVGIYISDGRFIHSPTTGKSVEISSLNDAYWARHFVGAKRPEALAVVANKG